VSGDRAPMLALLGPTASGKTEASIALAGALGAEILSVDSMLVYRGMDVGTAKPTPEQQSRVPHHLLDLADPSEPFSVTRFQAFAREALNAVRACGRLPLLVGGGGLYYRAVVDDLRFPGTSADDRGLLLVEGTALGSSRLHARLASVDPTAAAKIEPSNLRRTARALEVAAVTGRRFSSFAVAWERYPAGGLRAAGVLLPRAVLHRRIEERVATMMPGLLEETARLLDRGLSGFLTSLQAIGYAEAVACLRGELGGDEAGARTIRRTKALARRQLAWLRRDPRVIWFAAGEGGAGEVAEPILRYLRGAPAPERALARMEV
jgi:tRNA dimethylallyltransferase